MPIRKRKLILEATIGGFPVALGEVTITNFAKMYDYKPATQLVCPECGVPTKFSSGYECGECGGQYNHHSKLKRIIKGTEELLSKPRLIPEKTTAKASVHKMDAKDFAERFADATLSEAGMTAKDDTAQINIAKLVIAVERLGQVIVLRWNDTYESRTALLAVSSSNRILLREIIPANLLLAKETMRVDMDQITEQGITEAQQLLKMIPDATDDVFTATDYRATGLGDPAVGELAQAPKVQELSAILESLQATA